MEAQVAAAHTQMKIEAYSVVVDTYMYEFMSIVLHVFELTSERLWLVAAKETNHAIISSPHGEVFLR